MPSKRNEKLNKLLSGWQPGVVYTSSWLDEKGYSPDMIYGYKQSGWIKTLGRGAYIRFSDEPAWEGALYALQEQLKLPVHVGGETALQLQGYSHFISPKLSYCHLYTPTKNKLPKWFTDNEWGVEIILHISTLFGNKTLGIKELEQNMIPIKVADAERAILEMLSHVNSESTFLKAWQIMEGMMTLRPAMMQQLLEACNSVKVTRLCLYMSERHQLPWLKSLNKEKFDVGSGNRSIVKGGKLNEKYQITVPKSVEEETWA